MDKVFTNWLIIRSGFRQHKGGVGNGCVELLRSLAWHFGGNGNRVELEAWDDDPEHTADYIHRLGPLDRPPNVAIFAYSWGCGYGFVELARALRRHGIDVNQAVLCDPVYHGLAKWRALVPRTLFSKVYVTIPSNVSEVHWLRQDVSKPAGHDLRVESTYTKLHEPKLLQVPHIEMDNAPEFHQLCRQVAAVMTVKS